MALTEECLRDLAARGEIVDTGRKRPAHGRTPNRLVHARTPTTPQAPLKRWGRAFEQGEREMARRPFPFRLDSAKDGPETGVLALPAAPRIGILVEQNVGERAVTAGLASRKA
jgi:hypothetical protein